MKNIRTMFFCLPIAAAAISTAACVDRDGPLEQAAEEADEAVEDIGNGGETLENQIDDTFDEIEDEAEDAVDDLQQ